MVILSISPAMKTQKSLLARLIYLFILSVVLTACRQSDPYDELIQLSWQKINDSVVLLDSLATARRYSDPDAALMFSSRAVSLAAKAGHAEPLIKSLNTKGMILMVSQNDSARFYLERALRLTDSLPWKSERGYIYYNMARMHLEVNDHETAMALLDSSLQSAYRYHQPTAACAALLALGTLFNSSHDSAKARICYDSVLHLARRHQLARESGIALGNLALLRNDPQETVSMLREALRELERVKGAEAERAEFLQNMGYYQTLPDSAIRYYSLAVGLAERFGLRQAAVAAYNNMAYAFLDRKEPERAAVCMLEHAIPSAIAMNDDSWLATVYDTYADVLIRLNRFPEAVTFLRKSREAGIRADQSLAKKQVRLLGALLEMKNKNLLIAEQERMLTRKDIRINRLWMGLVIAGLLLVILAGLWLWLRQLTYNRISRLKLESARRVIEAEEHEKERTGMELHDAAGNLSWQIREAFERYPGFPEGLKTAVLYVISGFDDEIHNLSHRLNKKMLERRGPEDLFGELCRLAIRTGRLNLTWHIGTPGSPVPVPVITHLFRITQELLNNSRKHAPVAAIRLKIAFGGNRVELVYHDDGPGFDPAGMAAKGMGISNIFARADLMNGTAVLDAEPGIGTSWKITVHY